MNKIVEVLGMPPACIINQAQKAHKYFVMTTKGTWGLRKAREGKKVCINWLPRFTFVLVFSNIMLAHENFLQYNVGKKNWFKLPSRFSKNTFFVSINFMCLETNEDYFKADEGKKKSGTFHQWFVKVTCETG